MFVCRAAHINRKANNLILDKRAEQFKHHLHFVNDQIQKVLHILGHIPERREGEPEKFQILIITDLGS